MNKLRYLGVAVAFSLIFLTFPYIQKVEAQSLIYIRSDGSVEGTDKIVQSKGNIYTFTDDIFGEIKVQRGNCIIDGAGYALKGNWTGYDLQNYNYIKGIDLSNNRVSEPSRIAITSVVIKNLVITNFLYGIEGINSYDNTVCGCYISDCGRGINMPNNFLITNNTLKSGIFIDYTNSDNIITKNNMIPAGEYEEYPAANLVGVFLATQPTVNMNFWSDYNGTDIDGDGIGDTPYIINEENQDNYPIIEPFDLETIPKSVTDSASLFEERRFQVHDTHDFYYVTIVSNSTVSDFYFLYSSMRVSFYVNGTSGTAGLCNVTISSEFMSTEFSIFKDETPLVKNTDYTETFNGTHYLFTITYDHSTHLIQIYANNNIPEFPSWTPLLISLVAMVVVAVVYRKRLAK
ncbi:MAG: hypothetical protein CW691_02100 [Candidatus Bathyarchaeum sp.]|nr:MAG: hypothetical protein CW691_02100 [Candidatus Bathyarchaeum sp.]